MIIYRAGVYLILVSLAAIRVDSLLRSLYQRVCLTDNHPAAAAAATAMIRTSPWPKLFRTGPQYRLFSTAVVVGDGADDIKQHVLSVAPMMEYTDRHQRFLQRCLSRRSVLYTEMITSNALVRSDDKMRFLLADLEMEHPLVLQLGGSDPLQMGEAARIASDYGYKEMNLNVGCPSDRVAGAGCFGAALMLNPQLVCELALSISEVTNRPATVKCRIGVNDKDSYEELREFIRVVSERGHVRHFVIHARKAILNAKFSPHDNRTIPPLNYGFVYRLVDDFPSLHFTLNGGVGSIDHALQILGEKSSLAGVMVGRAVVNHPFHWSKVDSKMYGDRDPGEYTFMLLGVELTLSLGVSSSQYTQASAGGRYCTYTPTMLVAPSWWRAVVCVASW